MATGALGTGLLENAIDSRRTGEVNVLTEAPEEREGMSQGRAYRALGVDRHIRPSSRSAHTPSFIRPLRRP
jgi:hypothetical protein